MERKGKKYKYGKRGKKKREEIWKEIEEMEGYEGKVWVK